MDLWWTWNTIQRTADRTYQKLVKKMGGLREVCGHLRGHRRIQHIFPEATVCWGCCGCTPVTCTQIRHARNKPCSGGHSNNAERRLTAICFQILTKLAKQAGADFFPAPESEMAPSYGLLKLP